MNIWVAYATLYFWKEDMELIEVKDYLKDYLSQSGYRLYDYKLSRDGKSVILHITVDKIGYISLDEISLLADKISEDLSSKIKEDFMIDCCSAGAEKELQIEDIKFYLNEIVDVSIHHAVEKLDKIHGLLKEVNEEEIVVEMNFSGRKKSIKVNLSNIAHIFLAVK